MPWIHRRALQAHANSPERTVVETLVVSGPDHVPPTLKTPTDILRPKQGKDRDVKKTTTLLLLRSIRLGDTCRPTNHFTLCNFISTHGVAGNICKIASVCQHLFPGSTFVSRPCLCHVVGGRLVELVSGHPRPSSVEALVYRGCPCRDPPVCHRVQR